MWFVILFSLFASLPITDLATPGVEYIVPHPLNISACSNALKEFSVSVPRSYWLGLELRLDANAQRFISTTETVQLARDNNLFKSAQLAKFIGTQGGRVKPGSQALYCGDVRKRSKRKPAVRELESCLSILQAHRYDPQ
jgi:hypothetical protein